MHVDALAIDDRLIDKKLPPDWVGIGPLVGGDDDDRDEAAAYDAYCNPQFAPLFAAAPALLREAEYMLEAFKHYERGADSEQTGAWFRLNKIVQQAKQAMTV